MLSPDYQSFPKVNPKFLVSQAFLLLTRQYKESVDQAPKH